MLTVNQVATVLNLAVEEVTGKKPVEGNLLDLSQVVDNGKLLLEAGGDIDATYNSLYGRLLARVTDMVISNRKYTAGNGLMTDYRTYGALVEKVYFDPITAQDSAIWNLQNGKSVDPFIISAPETQTKVFSARNSWQIPYTISTRQIRASVTNDSEVMAFVNGIALVAENSMEMQVETLKNQARNNFIAERIHENNNIRVVKLLTEYNTLKGTTLTVDNALVDADFLKYASFKIRTTLDYFKKMTTLFSANGQYHFTPEEDLRLTILSYFNTSIETYLQSTTYNDALVKLNGYDTIPYWQGTGGSLNFSDISRVNVKTASGFDVDETGIVGIAHDIDAIGVTIWNNNVTSQYNGRGDYTNYWINLEVGLYNDLNENGAVFQLA